MKLTEIGKDGDRITNSYDFAVKYGKQHKHVRNKITTLLSQGYPINVQKGKCKAVSKVQELYTFENTFSDWLIALYKPSKYTIPMIEEWLEAHRPTIKLTSNEFTKEGKFQCRCLVEDCEHKWDQNFNSMKRQDSGCPLCNGYTTPTVEKMNSYLQHKNSPIKILGKFKTNHKRHNVTVQCLNEGCGRVWEGSWGGNIKSRGFLCGKCNGSYLLTVAELTDRIQGRPLKLLTTHRYSQDTPLIWKCTVPGCDCEWVAEWGNISTGHGCPLCGKRIKLAYQMVKRKAVLPEEQLKALKNTKAILYIIKCYNETETFYKIGLTTRTIALRFITKTEMPYKYDVLHQYTGSLYNIIQIEHNLHIAHKDYHILPKIFFDGSKKECFHTLNQTIISKNTNTLDLNS